MTVIGPSELDVGQGDLLGQHLGRDCTGDRQPKTFVFDPAPAPRVPNCRARSRRKRGCWNRGCYFLTMMIQSSPAVNAVTTSKPLPITHPLRNPWRPRGVKDTPNWESDFTSYSIPER